MAKTKEDIKSTKELARLKFISTNLTGLEVATLVGVTPATLSKWRKADLWDDQRAANNTQPLLLIKKYLKYMDNINERIDKENREPSSAELDQLSKLNKMVKDLRMRNTPQQVMEVMNEFNFFMVDKDQHLAMEIVGYVDEFVTKKIKEGKS